MNFLSSNIKFLREQGKLSQEKFAEQICITRSAYAKYELGHSEPSPEILLRIGRYYHVNLDLLISHDLRELDMDGLLKLDGNRILLPMKVSPTKENYIEIIPHTAKAGYLAGYSDPEFIDSLQYITLPFLKEGKYRAFPIEGDSMPPHTDGSFIVARLVERLQEVKDGRTYVVITRTEGISYKRITKKSRTGWLLSSDNTFYKSYEVKVSDILEVWEFACSIALKEFEPDNYSRENIRSMFMEIKSGINDIKVAVAN